ncbi:hypothetical protein MLD38_008348 [Melastoma candidum]|uniref:Uncharacterized protein n=1 Tax=Melastoma candidum TaxID=119954 RepID=A0ACB9RU71_9MYRT|nr:hypothetical protein MLD38_008348 [Melastoma candidum]
MQRKHYRGLLNPQCVHGIDVVAAPSLDGVDEEELKRWVELTGRDLNFSVPPKASEFCSWRNLPVMEFALDKPLPQVKISSNYNQTKLLNGSGLHFGPVIAAKTIYEDDQGYLPIVSLPFADLKRVKVTWWNNLTHGIVKISSVSTSCMPYVKRDGRTFKLADAFPEHCPPGEFVREIPLPSLKLMKMNQVRALRSWCRSTLLALRSIKFKCGSDLILLLTNYYEVV